MDTQTHKWPISPRNDVTNHQGDVGQIHSETPPHTHHGVLDKVSVGEDMEKLEPCTQLGKAVWQHLKN